jgi:superfamily I DNA/RNA helicase
MSEEPEIKLSELEKAMLRLIYEHNITNVGDGYPQTNLFSEIKNNPNYERNASFKAIDRLTSELKLVTYKIKEEEVFDDYKGYKVKKKRRYLFLKRQYYYLVETEEERIESKKEEKESKKSQEKRANLISQINKLKLEKYNLLKSENKLNLNATTEFPISRSDDSDFTKEAKRIFKKNKQTTYKGNLTKAYKRYINAIFLKKIGYFEFELIDQLMIDTIFLENQRTEWEFGIVKKTLQKTILNEGYNYSDFTESIKFLQDDINLIFADYRNDTWFYYINEFARTLFMSVEEIEEEEKEKKEIEELSEVELAEGTLVGQEYQDEEWDEIVANVKLEGSFKVRFTDEDQEKYKLETGKKKTLYNGEPTKDFGIWLEQNKKHEEISLEEIDVDLENPSEIIKKETKLNYKEALNKEQYAVVDSLSGNKLILAGAGSGKTRTLTYGVTKLIEEGVDQKSIVLVTFTVKASLEMRERMEELLKSIGIDLRGLRSGTFHALARYFIKYGKGFKEEDDGDPEGKSFGWIYLGYNLVKKRDGSDPKQSKNPKYTLELGQKRPKFLKAIRKLYFDKQLKEITKNKDLSKWEFSDEVRKLGKDFPTAQICGSIISATYNYRKGIREIINSFPQFLKYKPYTSQIISIYKDYQRKKKEDHYRDYDDLIEDLRQLLNNKQVLQLAKKFQYLFVDEYQDTNVVQNQIIEIWSKLSSTKLILVVGDDAQSIYAFRGANFYNILNFKDNFPNVTTQKLLYNYRSTKDIVKMANSSIKNNKIQYSEKNIDFLKPMNAIRDEYQKPFIINCPDHDVQIKYIIDKIKELHKEGIFHYYDGEQKTKIGVPYKEMAILFRNFAGKQDGVTYMIPNLIKELIAQKIPYVVTDFGVVEFFDKAHIKDYLSMFSFLREPNTLFGKSALGRIVEKYVNGVGRSTTDKLFESWIQYDKNPFITLQDPAKLKNKVMELNQKIKAKAKEQNYKPRTIIFKEEDAYVNLSDFITKLLNIKKEKNFGLQVGNLFNDRDININFKRLYTGQEKKVLEERIKDIELLIEIAYEHDNFESFEDTYLADRDPQKIKSGDFARWWDSKSDSEKKDSLLEVKVSLKQTEELLKKSPTWKLISKTNSNLATKLKTIYRKIKLEKETKEWWNKLPPEDKLRILGDVGVIEKKAKLLLKKIDKWESFDKKNLKLQNELRELYQFLLTNKVTITTIHKSKGLEWDTVFIPNLIQNTFPSYFALELGDESVEEERRVFYVAITRAKSHLFLTHHESTNDNQSTKRSQFINELEPHLYTEIQLDSLNEILSEETSEEVNEEEFPSELLEKIKPMLDFLQKNYKDWFNIPELKTNFDLINYYMATIGVNSENKVVDDDIINAIGILIELENDEIFTHLVNEGENLERKYSSISEDEMLYWDFIKNIPFHLRTEEGSVIIKKIIPEIKEITIEEEIEEDIEETIQEIPKEESLDWKLEKTLTAYGRFGSSTVYEYFIRGNEGKHIIHLTEDWKEQKIVKKTDDFYEFVLIYELIHSPTSPPDISAGKNLPKTEYFTTKEEFAKNIIERDLLDKKLRDKEGLIPYALVWAINLKDKELFINEPPIVSEANRILEKAELFEEEEKLVIKELKPIEIPEEPLIEKSDEELSEEEKAIIRLKPLFQYLTMTPQYKNKFSLPLLESKEDYIEIYRERIGIYSENCYFPKNINESKGLLIDLEDDKFYITLVPSDKSVEIIYEGLEQKPMLYWDLEERKPLMLSYESEKIIKSLPSTKPIDIDDAPTLTPSQKLIVQIGNDLFNSFKQLQETISDHLTLGDLDEQLIEEELINITIPIFYEDSGEKHESSLNFNTSESFNNALQYFDNLRKTDPIDFKDLLILIRNDILMKIGTERIYKENKDRELKKLSLYKDKESDNLSFWCYSIDKKITELDKLTQSKYLTYPETREAQRYLATAKNIQRSIANEWESLINSEKADIEQKVAKNRSVIISKEEKDTKEVIKSVRAIITHQFILDKLEKQREREKEIEKWWDGLSVSVRGEILEEEFELSLNEVEQISDYTFKELREHYNYKKFHKLITENYENYKGVYGEWEEEEEEYEEEEAESPEQTLMRELLERFQTKFKLDPYDVSEEDKDDTYSDIFIAYLKSLGYSEEKIEGLLAVEWEYEDDEEELSEEERIEIETIIEEREEWKTVINEENYRVQEKGNRERHIIIFPDGQKIKYIEKIIGDYSNSSFDGIIVPIADQQPPPFSREMEREAEIDKAHNVTIHFRDIYDLKKVRRHKDFLGWGGSVVYYLDVFNRKTYDSEKELIEGITKDREKELISWNIIFEEPEYELLLKGDYERHIIKKGEYYREWISLKRRSKFKYIIVAEQTRNSEYHTDTLEFLEIEDDDGLIKFIDNRSNRYSNAKDYRIYFTINLLDRDIIRRFDLLGKTVRKNLTKLGEVQKLVLQAISDKAFWEEKDIRTSLKRTTSVASMLRSLTEKGLINKYGIRYKITNKGIFVLEQLKLKIKEAVILKSNVDREELKEKDIDIRFKIVEYHSKLIHNTEDSAKLELQQQTELWNQNKPISLELFPFDARIIEENGKYRVYINNSVYNTNYYENNGVLPSKDIEEEIEPKIKITPPKVKITMEEEKSKEKRSLNELEAKYTEIYDKKAIWGGKYTNKFKEYLSSEGYSSDEIEDLLPKEIEKEEKSIKQKKIKVKKPSKTLSDDIVSLTKSIKEKKVILKRARINLVSHLVELIKLITDRNIKPPSRRRQLRRHTYQEEDE